MKIFLPSQRPLIMGIVNVTPDSFSGDGLMTHGDAVGAAVRQARQMLTEGADLLDIGGESTRPGSVAVGADEELARVVPVIEALCGESISPPLVSIDTTKAVVAEAALRAGASIVNDVSALEADPLMASVVASHQAPVVLMDNRSKGAAIWRDARLGAGFEAADHAGDIVAAVRGYLQQRLQAALAAEIALNNIILDPGLGFGKSLEQNMALMRELEQLASLGCPLLVGPSRKSFIGQVLDLPVEERLEGTAALVALAAFKGAAIIRVHDVKFMSRVARMAGAVRGC